MGLGAVSHRAGLLGGLMGMATFLVTLSFSFGAELWKEGYGFPYMGGTAQFLFKDAGLLALCLALTLDSIRNLCSGRSTSSPSTTPARASTMTLSCTAAALSAPCPTLVSLLGASGRTLLGRALWGEGGCLSVVIS